jgi:uncharacterized protein
MAGRKLNIPLIKNIIMLVVGFFVAIGSALTGIGAQVAAAPMIQFLLGYAPDKTKGTALAFALFAAVGATTGIMLGGVKINLGIGLLIALGATIGAILVAAPSQNPKLRPVRRLGQSLGILIGIYVLGEAVRQRVGGPAPVALSEWVRANAGLGGFLIGVFTGAASQLFQVASGILLVPAIIYFAARPVGEAIGTSLLVVAVASVLPTLTYSAKQSIDQRTGPWMTVGGALGGLAGGLMLARLFVGGPVPFVLFAVVAMFLSAWAIWRMT